jgi:hypothetical protein
LKRIYNQISSKEFKEEKLISFKEYTIGLLEELLSSNQNDKLDRITIPYIFTVLKKSFFKLKTSSKRRGFTESNSAKSLEIQQKNSELMVKSFDIALKYISTDLHEDIILSALNYLFKFLDEPISISYKDNPQTSV